MRLSILAALTVLSLILMSTLPFSVDSVETVSNQTFSATDMLVVQHREPRFWFTDNALSILNIPHDTISVADLNSTDLSPYRFMLVGAQIGTIDEVKPFLDAASEGIRDWITSGGCIAVFGQYENATVFDLDWNLCTGTGSGYYKWLPDSPGFLSISSEDVHITDSTHPITAGFTDEMLSYWGSSADGYFISTQGETLAVHSGFDNRTALYAQLLGDGKIVCTGLDPDYHGFIFNARGEEGKEQARRFLNSILNWFEGLPPPPSSLRVSVSTDASSSLIGLSVVIQGDLEDNLGDRQIGELIVISYTFAGARDWYPISSDVTDDLGEYLVQWIPTASGNFSIRAEWQGNQTFPATQSIVALSILPHLTYVFSVESNSTISALEFNSTSFELAFTASGPSGSTGYAKVIIAKSLIENAENIRVYLDGNSLNYTVTSTDKSWMLFFEYSHSIHRIMVTKTMTVGPPHLGCGGAFCRMR